MIEMNETYRKNRDKILKEINGRFPYKELDYRNFIVASLFAKGMADKMTEDWLRRVLIGDIEDGFITYGQAMTIKDDYYKMICELRGKYGA